MIQANHRYHTLRSGEVEQIRDKRPGSAGRDVFVLCLARSDQLLFTHEIDRDIEITVQIGREASDLEKSTIFRNGANH